MSRCNFVDPSTGFTHQEIIDGLQEEIAAHAKQIVELARVRRDLVEACKQAFEILGTSRAITVDALNHDCARAMKILEAARRKAEGQ
jgi:tRNA C32,U32 (ribose-2'-O)-methylase TrmJ